MRLAADAIAGGGRVCEKRSTAATSAASSRDNEDASLIDGDLRIFAHFCAFCASLRIFVASLRMFAHLCRMFVASLSPSHCNCFIDC